MKSDGALFNELVLRQLDLNLLLTFSALMRERSVKGAARRLSLGASAISMSLSRLRQTLGDELFVRSGGGMEPTPKSLELWQAVAPALDTIEDAIRKSKDFTPARSEAIFKLVVPDDLEFVLVPRLIDALAEKAPSVLLVVRPADFRSPFARLIENDADLSVAEISRPVSEKLIYSEPFLEDDVSVLFDPAVVPFGTNITIEQYIGVPHLIMSPAGLVQDDIDEALARRGQRRSISAVVSHYPTMPFILRGRPLVADMPTIAAKAMARTYDLACCHAPLGLETMKIGLVWHPRSDKDKAHIWFRSVVREVLLELGAGETAEPSSPG